MPKLTYKTCRVCGRHASEVGLLSHTRTCIECAHAIQESHNLQMHQHNGPWFERWRLKMAASVGAIIPEYHGHKDG